MEFLSQHILWWHWIVLGIALSAAEILIPSFIVIWFGMAALIVGVVDYLFGTDFATELFLWSILSLMLTFIYWRWFKKHEPPLPIGQSEGEYADIPGVITEEIGNGRYRARFDLPVLGDREWIVETENHEALKKGDAITVTRVYGQIIKVKPSTDHNKGA